MTLSRTLRSGLLGGTLLAMSLMAAAQDTAAPADAAPAEPTPVAVAETPAMPDLGAQAYLAKCSGCHSVGGAPRSAPDLLHVSSWKDADLHASIKRMEKNAGPLPDEEVALLAAFLKDSAVRARLSAEEERVARLAAASLEPASAAKGRALFDGTMALANGGSSCTACHTIGGRGGNLGPDLTDVHTRLGAVALSSAIEKANFLVMKPIYAARPVTKQEAAHMTAYLATTAGGETASQEPPLGIAALAASAGLLALLGLFAKGRRLGTRARLVAEATRR